jgi:hypothetical protein
MMTAEEYPVNHDLTKESKKAVQIFLRQVL